VNLHCLTIVIASIGIDPNQLIRNVGLFGLFVVVFAESGLFIGFFLPGDSLLFTAGLLGATTNLLSPFPLIVFGCVIAAIVGDQVGYLFGQRFGPRLFSQPDSRFLKRKHLERAEEFFERHGSKTVLLARFVPVVRTFAPIVAGASKMHWRTFSVYNVIGGTTWVVLLMGLGWALGTRYPGIADSLDLAILVIVAISLVPLGIEYLRHRRSRPAKDSQDL
jgi:membrane-associated protein